MKVVKMELIIVEENLPRFIGEYIKQMVIFGYTEEYIGKTLAYIIDSLERKK